MVRTTWSTNRSTGNPKAPGAKKRWNKKILSKTGVKITKAKGTKYPVSNKNPTKVSVPLRSGKKYPDWANPPIKAAGKPDIGGCGIKWRNPFKPNTKNTKPRSTLAIIDVVFITKNF